MVLLAYLMLDNEQVDKFAIANGAIKHVLDDSSTLQFGSNYSTIRQQLGSN